MNQCKRVSSLKFLAGRAIQSLSPMISAFSFLLLLFILEQELHFLVYCCSKIQLPAFRAQKQKRIRIL